MSSAVTMFLLLMPGLLDVLSATEFLPGTLSAEQLASSAALIPDMSLDRNDRQQRFFFDLVFTCNGYITKWTVGADYIGGPLPPQLQVWRKINGTDDTYDKVQIFDLGSPSATVGENLYVFLPPSPVPVREGDILGLFNPCKDTKGRTNPCTDEDVASWIVYYKKNAGIVNHRIDGRVISPNFTMSVTKSELEEDNGTEIPLVSVEIIPDSIWTQIQTVISSSPSTSTYSSASLSASSSSSSFASSSASSAAASPMVINTANVQQTGLPVDTSSRDTMPMLVAVIIASIAGLSILVLSATLLTVATLGYKHKKRETLVPEMMENNHQSQCSSQGIYHVLNHSPNNPTIIPQGYTTFQPCGNYKSGVNHKLHVYDYPEKLPKKSTAQSIQDMPSSSNQELSHVICSSDKDVIKTYMENNPAYNNELFSSTSFSKTASEPVDSTLSSEGSHREISSTPFPWVDSNKVQGSAPSLMASSTQSFSNISETDGNTDKYTAETNDMEYNLSYLSASRTHMHTRDRDHSIPPPNAVLIQQH